METAGALTNGMTLFIPADRLAAGTRASTQVAREVNARRFLDLFVERLAAPPRGR